MLVRVAVLLVCLSATLSNSDVRNELMEAVLSADYQIVKFLLSLDPTVLTSRPPVLVDRVEEMHGRTPLLACGLESKGRDRDTLDTECVRIARVLSKKGANMSHVDRDGWDAVSIGAVRGYTKFCRYLVSKHKLDPNRRDAQGRTSLMKAAGHGHFGTFATLLNYSANASIAEPENGMTAIHFATTFALQNSGQTAFLRNVTELLTGSGVHAKKRQTKEKTSRTAGSAAYPLSLDAYVDKNKRTPLMYAAISNNAEVLEVLLEAASDPRLTDSFGIACTSMPRDEQLRVRLLEAAIARTEADHKEWLQRTRKEQLDNAEL